MENAAAAKASPYAIELDGCTFCYKGASRPSLRDVSLKIPRGQCVVVTGQSGCGKTTLTRLVNALIPLMYEGDLQGEVLVAGKPSFRMDDGRAFRACRVGVPEPA